MQISLQHTPNSVREMSRMQTPGWRRGLRGLRYVRLLIYGVIGMWVGAGMILRGAVANPRNTHDIGSGLALIAVVALVCGIFIWQGRRKVAQGMAAQMPTTLDITSAGISTCSMNGANHFEPWSVFSSFREGRHTVALTRQGKATPLFIPLEGLEEVQRGSLRSMLLSQLPERN